MGCGGGGLDEAWKIGRDEMVGVTRAVEAIDRPRMDDHARARSSHRIGEADRLGATEGIDIE